MSFSTITDIKKIVAIHDNKEYNVISLDIKMSLGGSSRVSFVLSGEHKEAGTTAVSDLSKFSESSGFIKFGKGAWVTLSMTYSDISGSDKTATLFSGRVIGMNDQIRLASDNVALGRGYVLGSESEFAGKLPLGSLYVPSVASGGGDAFTSAVAINTETQLGIAQTLINKYGGNIAKLAAELIDIKTTKLGKTGSGVFATTPAQAKEIKEIVNIDNAPTLNEVLSSSALGEAIGNYLNRGYATTPPLELFKQTLSKFFLICAPRTNGKADVVENNGWKKSDKTANIGYDLITGINTYEASNVNPGFDAVAVDITSTPTTKSSNPIYVVCAETFDPTTGRSKLFTGTTKTDAGGSGLTIIGDSGGSGIAVGSVRRINLADWMKNVELSNTKKSDDKINQATESAKLWAKWLAFGAYAELNRIANRVSLELRLPGYLELADKLGEVVNFNIPGRDDLYYGRLIEVGLQFSLNRHHFSANASATMDCVRDKTDNDNLCIDFTLYKASKKEK